MRDIVQMGFDYSVLSSEQAQRTQEAEIRIIGRTQKTIIENGRDLLAVKQDIGHGHFLNWIKSLRISEDTAERYINVAKNFGQIPQTAEFDKTALYLLSHTKVPESAREEAKQRAADGEKITEEIARQIRDAHKAKDEAEQKARLAQQQLFTAQSEAQTQIAEYTSQINELKQEMADLVKPEVQIKEVQVIPQTVKDQLQRLQDKAKALTTQRDNLAAMNKKLSADLDVVEAKREQEARDARIRLDFQKLTKATYDTLIKFATQIPMHVDLPVLEPDDWARIEELASTMSQISERLFGLHKSMTNQFVDASTGSIVEA